MNSLLVLLIRHGSYYLSAASPETEAEALATFSLLWAKLPKVRQSVPPSLRSDFGLMLLCIAAKGTDLGRVDPLRASLAKFSLLFLPYRSVDWDHARALAGEMIVPIDLSAGLGGLDKLERSIKLSSGYLAQAEESE